MASSANDKRATFMKRIKATPTQNKSAKQNQISSNNKSNRSSNGSNKGSSPARGKGLGGGRGNER